MIITYNNCTKNFSVDSDVIPEKGRLLQCNGCNHKWFFKKDVLNEPNIKLAEKNKSNEKIELLNEELELVAIKGPETIEFLDKKDKEDSIIEKVSINNNKTNKNEDKEDDNGEKIIISKNKKNFTLLSKIIVFIITFIALIIILDTFQVAISKNFLHIEHLLYNLYESIAYIGLFFRDLI